MADFDRFEPNGVRDPQESEMLPDDDGQFVLYDEALTALQQQRKQVIAEVEEALTSDEVVRLAAQKVREGPDGLTTYGAAKVALRAALATLKGGTNG